ncbi:MAG: helix-hairpin-helix domain-containing protein [Firmicutes bacterium]|nr:helix-hairpin-helix domain-containing protein [Bacillota bacterium]
MSNMTPNRYAQPATVRKPPIGWLLLLYAPFVGYISMLYMGREAKRESWHRIGMIFGWALWGLLVLHWFLSNTMDIRFVQIFQILLYVLQIILGSVWWGGFKKIYAFDHAVLPDFLPGDKKWQRRHSLWLLWSLVPWGHSLMFLQIGYRAGKKQWIRMGWAFWVVTSLVIPFITNVSIGDILSDKIYWAFRNQGFYPSYSMFIGLFPFIVYGLATAFFFTLGLYYRKEYLKTIWPEEAAARSRYAILEKPGWRFTNSLWMAICLVPFGSGGSLVFSGIRIKQRRFIMAGILLILLPLVYLIGLRALNVILSHGARSFFENRLVNYSDVDRDMYYLIVGLQEMYRAINLIIVPMLSFALCCSIREKYLQTTAANYGGFKTQIDRELAAREIERFQAMREETRQQEEAAERYFTGSEPRRVLDASQPVMPAAGAVQPMAQTAVQYTPQPMQPAPRPSQPAPQHAVQPAVQDAEEPSESININTCTQEELMKLPGVSVAMAMRAMQHREEIGGFATVDDFVDYLGLKPHFAVQVFEIATIDRPIDRPTERPASAEAADPGEAGEAERRAPRRHLDF